MRGICTGERGWKGKLVLVTMRVEISTAMTEMGSTSYFITLWVDLICAGGGGCTRRVGGAET